MATATLLRNRERGSVTLAPPDTSQGNGYRAAPVSPLNWVPEAFTGMKKLPPYRVLLTELELS